MKFTLALAEMKSLLRTLLPPRPKKSDRLEVSACAARVFLKLKGNVAGIEALVCSDGSLTVSAKGFRDVLATYRGKTHLEFTGDAEGLRIERFKMGGKLWNPHPAPPAEFQIFPVTDLGIIPGQPAGGSKRRAPPND